MTNDEYDLLCRLDVAMADRLRRCERVLRELSEEMMASPTLGLWGPEAEVYGDALGALVAMREFQPLPPGDPEDR